MPHIDLTFQQTIHEVKLAVLFHCPYCRRPVTEAQRLRYRMDLVQLFDPIYRCRCNKYFGCPTARSEEAETCDTEAPLDRST